MISRSLRKHPTTPWSMLQKTDSAHASRGLARWLRHAGLAGLAMITLASGTLADDVVVRPGSVGSRTGKSPAEVSGRAKLTSPSGWSRVKNQLSVTQASLSQEQPLTEIPREDFFPPLKSSDSPSADVTPHRGDKIGPASVPQTADQSKAETTGRSNYSEHINATFEAAHRRRMENLMAGHSAPGSVNSVGDWWHKQSQQFVFQNRQLTAAAGRLPQTTQESARRFLAEHTLPDDIEPEIDFYDSNPIALSAPSLMEPFEDSRPEEGFEPKEVSRLKTDIRTISPTLSYALKGIKKEDLPSDFDERLEAGEYIARQTSPTVLQWAPSNLWYYPLYFEDPALERYGHSYHPLVQPFASTGRFATQLAGLPYQMALHPVHSKQYPLGYYRPGEPAPKKFYQIPFNEEATLLEVATIAGLILIFP